MGTIGRKDECCQRNGHAHSTATKGPRHAYGAEKVKQGLSEKKRIWGAFGFCHARQIGPRALSAFLGFPRYTLHNCFPNRPPKIPTIPRRSARGRRCINSAIFHDIFQKPRAYRFPWRWPEKNNTRRLSISLLFDNGNSLFTFSVSMYRARTDIQLLRVTMRFECFKVLI